MVKVIEEIETKHEYDQVTRFVVPFCGFGESTFKKSSNTFRRTTARHTRTVCLC